MERKVYYSTVVEALEKLKAKGYCIDFNLEENLLGFKNGKYNPVDFEVVDAYRYEGASDPGDEATVYALESKSGLKGVLVSGYGSSSDVDTTELLKNLKIRKR
jgi:hypothetical protein